MSYMYKNVEENMLIISVFTELKNIYNKKVIEFWTLFHQNASLCSVKIFFNFIKLITYCEWSHIRLLPYT